MRHRVTVVVLSVCVCVYLSVCLLPQNLLPTSFIHRKQRFFDGVFNVITVSLMLHSKVLASFGHHRLPRSLASF